ncbi:MAG: tRNA (N(6)-L-threonylcarbamoyladenosine(37)-C(2))-methylthiotransferase MtaB [Crocinitomicaceae bacterium]|nr:tRNA (N(6)-L-threonylcarbamoyladenosine(37)-C(2))-methylthiotransferase MtaB [Crocinitomicaceae bacterium]
MQEFHKVAYYTLGCKLNFSETSTIARELAELGFAKVDFNEFPDIYVINTCSVTENADKKCRQIVKKALGINPNAYVIVIGCYAQLKPDDIASIPGVDLVLGANEKFNIKDYLDKIDKKEVAEIQNENIKTVNGFIPSHSYGDRTRSFLKIQDGCDYFCTFCTIPLARGKSRNSSIEETVKQAQKVADTEIKEVVITGVNIGDFGQGSEENFYNLIQEFDQVDGIDRFRISSIEPNLLSNDIIDFVAQSKKFVPHFHIPLQSGSDELLQKMRRKYLTSLYSERIDRIKEKIQDCCIGVDVIVGFPGETEEKFLETYNYLNDLDVSYLHVFTYSERANTTAKKMPESVDMGVRKKRSKMLQILSLKKKRAFYESQLGKELEVLLEAEREGNDMFGFTENYVKVKIPYDESLVNSIRKVRLKKIDSEGRVEAELI